MASKTRRPSPLTPLPQPGEGKHGPSSISRPIPSPGSRRGAGERSLLKFAKHLRSEQTDAELKPWYYLRAGRFMGRKFKRQKPIGPYIADFACTEYKLIIECDGSQHRHEHDTKRDTWFVRNGYTILRFWNNAVLQESESVLEQIRQTIVALRTTGE